MALYDLVALRQSLIQAVNIDNVIHSITELRNKIDSIRYKVPVLPDEHADYINKLLTYYDQLIKSATLPYQDLKDRLSLIDEQINTITHQLFADNYNLEEQLGTADNVRNHKRIAVSQDIEQDIKQRILLHTDWRYPALEIGCRDGEWTQYMVAADPLYIIDRYPEFLDSTNSRFPELYQRRLRKYQLKNQDLSILPTAQMGFVFSWGYFNYVSIDTMRQYLRQIFELLRPGGIFFFSYNDGDTTFGAGMAEHFTQTYMPKSLLTTLADSLGYEINKTSDYGNNIHWIELKKPGTLHTVKAHQVLGEIKRQEK